MPGAFDPYHRWLGIPPEDQPTTCYRLLGLKDFENDPDVIESAADRQMTHLRSFQTGEHGALSQELLNEVAKAKIQLLKAREKAAYDARLRQELEAKKAPMARAIPLPGTPASPADEESGIPTRLLIALGSVVAGLVVILVLVIWLVSASTDLPEEAEGPAGDSPLPTSHRQAPPVEPSTTGPSTRPTDLGTVPSNPVDPAPPIANVPSVLPYEEPGEPTPLEEAPPIVGTNASVGTNAPVGPTDPVPEPPQEPVDSRHAVPAVDVQQTILAQLDELYDLAKKRSPAEALELSAALHALAAECDDPNERFVLLRKSMELAGEEGKNAVRMCRLIDAMAKDFRLDLVVAKQYVLSKFADRADDAEEIASLLESSRTFIDSAVGQQRFDAALEVATATCRACQRPQGRDYRKETYDRRREVERLQEEYQRVEEMLARVQADPSDAEANLHLGRLYCFARNDWQQGLPYLARGSDAELAALAGRELDSPPRATAEQLELADAWWDLAEKRGADEQKSLRLRAGIWYRQAQPQVAGILEKVKLEKRLEEIGPIPSAVVEPEKPRVSRSDEPVIGPVIGPIIGPVDQPPSSPAPDPPSQPLALNRWVDVIPAIDIARDKMAGDWSRRGDTLVLDGLHYGAARLQLPLRVTGSYDLEVQFTRHAGNENITIVLPVGRRACRLSMNAWEGEASGLEEIDGKSARDNSTVVRPGTLTNGKLYRVLCRVREDGENATIAIFHDGKEFTSWTGKLASLSTGKYLTWPNQDQPGFYTKLGDVTYHRVRFCLVGGTASWIEPSLPAKLPTRTGQPVNLAQSARVIASSYTTPDFYFNRAVDGKIAAPGSGKGRGIGWAATEKDAQDEVVFRFYWERPVYVEEIVYIGRTSLDGNEVFKDFQIYRDSETEAIGGGTFEMSPLAQHIKLPQPTRFERLTIKFLNSYGGKNPGADEILVFDRKLTDPGKQLPLFLTTLF